MKFTKIFGLYSHVVNADSWKHPVDGWAQGNGDKSIINVPGVDSVIVSKHGF